MPENFEIFLTVHDSNMTTVQSKSQLHTHKTAMLHLHMSF